VLSIPAGRCHCSPTNSPPEQVSVGRSGTSRPNRVVLSGRVAANIGAACTVAALTPLLKGRAVLGSNDALKMPKVLLAIIAAGVVVLIAVLVVAVFSL
jgi:hypothetical protein